MSRSMEQFGSSTKWNSGFAARAHVQGFLKHSLRASELKHLASLILTIRSLDGLPRGRLRIAEGCTSLNIIRICLLRSSDYVLLGQSDKTSCVLRMTVGMPLDRCAPRVMELG